MDLPASRSDRLPLPDPGRSGEVEGEIDEEIRFHLDMRARDLAEEGLEEPEARRRAEALFGDVARIRRECRRIRLGDRILMQRIQWILIGALAVAVGVTTWGWIEARRASRELAQEARAAAEREGSRREAAAFRNASEAPPTPAEPSSPAPRAALAPAPGADPELLAATWIARFAERPKDWRRGWSLAERIAALPPAEGARILAEAWPTLEPEVKRQALKPFVFGAGHPFALDVLHLAALDADPETQSRAFGYLEAYAFRDFSADYEAYLAWRARWEGRPLPEVLASSARELVGRLSGLSGEDLASELRALGKLDLSKGGAAGVDLAGILREAGGVSLLEGWLLSGEGEAEEAALRWAATLDPGEDWLRANVLPRLEASGPGAEPLLDAALGALARPECAFARDDVLGFMDRRLGGPPAPEGADSADGTLWQGARTLAAMGDPAAIPRMIEMIAREESYDTVYGVGWFGLNRLTGVDYDESHGAEWWIDWWERNRSRFPAGVREIEIERAASPK